MARQTVELASVGHDPASHSHALIRGILTFFSPSPPSSAQPLFTEQSRTMCVFKSNCAVRSSRSSLCCSWKHSLPRGGAGVSRSLAAGCSASQKSILQTPLETLPHVNQTLFIMCTRMTDVLSKIRKA